MAIQPDPERPDNWKEEAAEVHNLLTRGHNPYLRYIWEVVSPDGVAVYSVEVQLTPKSSPIRGDPAETPMKAYDLLLQKLGGSATSVQSSIEPASTSASA